MNNPALDIRIGTLVKGNEGDPANYIRQILPYGFESFQLTFWRTLGEALDVVRADPRLCGLRARRPDA